MIDQLRFNHDTVLGAISEHTGLMRYPLWLRHVRYNRKHYGFERGIKVLHTDVDAFGHPGIVLAAGSAFKALGYMPQLEAAFKAQRKTDLAIIACDLSLPLLARKGYKPDLVCSVDAHPVVANFYRRSRKILRGTKVLLPTSIHPDVVEECLSTGAEIYWWQPFWSGDGKLYTQDVAMVHTGGNVGTTSYVILSMGLKCTPIGLLCLEFAWSDETPLWSEDFYGEVRKAADGIKLPHLLSQFNSLDRKMYVADAGYMNYLGYFKRVWKKLPEDIRQNTYNLTREGILPSAGVPYLPIKDFLERFT